MERENLDTRSEAELLHMALGGEETAFLILYERLKRNIFRYAFYMTSSKSLAEEVTQDVFVALLKEGRKFREDRGDVGAFAFGIARNFVRRIERHGSRNQVLSTDRELESLSANLVSQAEELPSRIMRDQIVSRVQVAIASLPDHYRQVVVLCDLCELSYAEASARLDCALGTVRSRLNRAHALLAAKLRPMKDSQTQIQNAGPEGCLI